MVDLSRIDISAILAPPRRCSFFSESKVSDGPDPLGQKRSLLEAAHHRHIAAQRTCLPANRGARQRRRDIPGQRQNRTHLTLSAYVLKPCFAAGLFLSPPARGAVAVLNIGGMNDNVQQETQRVDQDVPLATLDLLARVVARRIKPRPPF